MADLIDRAALGIGKANPKIFENAEYAKGWNSAIEILRAAPAVDAVKVVRCKKCIHAQWSKKNKAYYCKRRWALHKVRERDFCSYGERREDDG